MSRYINDVQTSKSPAEIEAAVRIYLGREGFTRKRRHGEEVWEKGLGLMMGPQFIKADPVEGKVHVEAWTSAAPLPGLYVGELGTTGFFAALPKRRLRERVEELERILV
jgi:hypothetical protein